MVHFPHADTVGIFGKEMRTDLLGLIEVFLLHLVFASPAEKQTIQLSITNGGKRGTSFKSYYTEIMFENFHGKQRHWKSML